MAIARHWTGIAKKEKANEYISHLQNDTFEKLKTMQGFIKASILKREINANVEFLIISEWESVEAIKKFTGENINIAVVPPEAQQLLIHYDTQVRHYEVNFVTF